jgi:hypothetical protein
MGGGLHGGAAYLWHMPFTQSAFALSQPFETSLHV